NVVRAQGGGKFREHAGKLPQAVKADVPAGEHIVPQAHRVLQPVQGGHGALRPLRDPHPHVVGADLNDGGGAGGAFLIQGVSLLSEIKLCLDYTKIPWDIQTSFPSFNGLLGYFTWIYQ